MKPTHTEVNLPRRKMLSKIAMGVSAIVLAACGGGSNTPAVATTPASDASPASSTTPTSPTTTVSTPISGTPATSSPAVSTPVTTPSTPVGSTAPAAATGAATTTPSNPVTSTPPATTQPSTPVDSTPPATTPSDPTPPADTTPVSDPPAASDPPATTPVTPVKALPANVFHGINGHYDYNMYSNAQIISMMTALGMTTYRVAYEGNQTSLDKLVSLAKSFVSAKLNLFVCIDMGINVGMTPSYVDEAAAYNQGVIVGTLVASALAPYGVTMYECGNELTRQDITITNYALMGSNPKDYYNAGWQIMRGAMRGMIDGVKSVQPAAFCGICFCVGDIAASDMLWGGTQPDGTSGHPLVRWDITTWHNYQVYGDLFNIAVDGDGKGAHNNIPAYCKAKYGVPFMITEWSANPEVSQADRATYITDRVGAYWTNRKADNIASIMYYELDSGNQEWGLVINGVPNTVPYTAMQNIIKSCPDV